MQRPKANEITFTYRGESFKIDLNAVEPLTGKTWGELLNETRRSGRRAFTISGERAPSRLAAGLWEGHQLYFFDKDAFDRYVSAAGNSYIDPLTKRTMIKNPATHKFVRESIMPLTFQIPSDLSGPAESIFHSRIRSF